MSELQTPVTSDDLLIIIGVTPADNVEEFPTVVPWKSKWVGAQIKNMFGWQRILDSLSKDVLVFGPPGSGCRLAKRMAGRLFKTG